MRTNLAKFIACLVLLPALSLARPVAAHPHVWTDYWVEAVSDQDGIVELRFTWRFDTMFSTMLRNDLKIAKMNPEAIKKLRDKAFANLKNFHYYIYIQHDGAEFLPQSVKDFSARDHGEQIEYLFTIALPKPAKTVEVSLYDEELYVDIGPPMQDGGAPSGIMAKAQPKPQAFVTASARNGAKPPVCSQDAGITKKHPMWGDYQTYTARCAAEAP
jgi:ABC-type uncharacterized transport system substrate-binding protein